MGQQEVYNFLRDNPGKWYTSRQITEKMQVSIGSVTNSLAKLRKHDAILYKNSKERANFFLYKYKK